MRKSLFIIPLAITITSCATQKPVARTYKPAVKPKTVTTTTPQKTPAKTTTLTGNGNVEFYRTNIGDITKNDNTISYGSIVTAAPLGYKVTKTNFPAVGQNFRQRYLILHYTALPLDKSVSTLTQQSVSSHYLVNDTEDNEIYQLVDENKRAYHAGISAWRNDKNLNDNSIGIEIVNTGYTVNADGKRIFAVYPETQFRKVAALAKDIVTRYNIPPTNVLGHSDIAPTRKQDPGSTFPWKRLYDEYQLGMWYDESAKQNFLAAIASNPDFPANLTASSFTYQVQTALKNLGYDIMPTGEWTAENRKVVEAFQFHFRPADYSGTVDAETWAILQALNQKYPNK